MKLYLCSLLAASAVSVEAFTAGLQPSCQHRIAPVSVGSSFVATASTTTTTTTTALRMSDDFDFPSAMPEKPKQTMKEKMEESATQFIADLSMRLADGVEEPPEMAALREVRDAEDSDEKILALKIYELMIEQGMRYDIDPETGRLSPTNFDIKNNLDIPEVKAEFKHLYSYGIELIKRELIDMDTCKEIVQKRLIDRTGLAPEEFDKWLGY